MKKLCAIVILAALGMRGLQINSEEPSLPGQLIDGIAAIVNTKIITLGEVRAAVAPFEEDILRTVCDTKEREEKLRAARLDTLNKLVERALILQAFGNEKDSQGNPYHVPEEWIDRQTRDIIHHDYDDNPTLFANTLRERGTTMAAFRQEVRERAIVQFMRDREVSSNIFISPFKIQQYYRQNQDRYKVNDQIKLRLIFIKRGDEDRRAVAEEIARRIAAGENFEQVAQSVSEDKLTKDRGGDFGWVTRQDLRAELADVAFKLNPQEHSGVVATPDGFYLLQVDDAKPAHVKSISEVRDEVEKILTQQEKDRLQREWIERLKRKAHIRFF